MSLKIIALSDTHNRHNKLKLEPCNILIHTGDYSFQGTDSEIENFYKWFNKQEADHLVSIQGNHEKGYEKNPARAQEIIKSVCLSVHLLDHSSINLEGINIFGSPYTPEFCNWAFNVERGEPLKKLWAQIPDNTNVLATHGMPYGILDEVMFPQGAHVGDNDLFNRIMQLKELKYYIGGHLHLNGGRMKEFNGVKFINAAVCNEQYHPNNPIMTFEY